MSKLFTDEHIKKTLREAKGQGTVNFAFGEADKEVCYMVVDGDLKPEALFQKLKSGEQVKKGTWGKLDVQGTTLVLQPERPYSGLKKKVEAWAKHKQLSVSKVAVVGDQSEEELAKLIHTNQSNIDEAIEATLKVEIGHLVDYVQNANDKFQAVVRKSELTALENGPGMATDIASAAITVVTTFLPPAAGTVGGWVSAGMSLGKTATDTSTANAYDLVRLGIDIADQLIQIKTAMLAAAEGSGARLRKENPKAWLELARIHVEKEVHKRDPEVPFADAVIAATATPTNGRTMARKILRGMLFAFYKAEEEQRVKAEGGVYERVLNATGLNLRPLVDRAYREADETFPKTQEEKDEALENAQH